MARVSPAVLLSNYRFIPGVWEPANGKSRQARRCRDMQDWRRLTEN